MGRQRSFSAVSVSLAAREKKTLRARRRENLAYAVQNRNGVWVLVNRGYQAIKTLNPDQVRVNQDTWFYDDITRPWGNGKHNTGFLGDALKELSEAVTPDVFRDHVIDLTNARAF